MSNDDLVKKWRARSKRLKRQNRARKEREFKKRFGSVERVLWIKRQKCVGCGTRNGCENAHTRSRGAGGTWRDVVPLCRDCHRELHVVGIETFQQRRKLNLSEMAETYVDRWAS